MSNLNWRKREETWATCILFDTFSYVFAACPRRFPLNSTPPYKNKSKSGTTKNCILSKKARTETQAHDHLLKRVFTFHGCISTKFTYKLLVHVWLRILLNEIKKNISADRSPHTAPGL